METFDSESFVRAALPDYHVIDFKNTQKMGFSGALVSDVVCDSVSGSKMFFLKVVEPQPLPESATDAEKQKWQRNLQSYANEAAFLSDQCLQSALRSRGVCMPETLSVHVTAGKCFAILAESMKSSHVLLSVHPAGRTPEVLQWLAGFHRTFHGQVPSNQPLWEFGGHVHLDRRQPGELEILPSSISNFCQAFQGESAFFARPEAKELGSRLQKVARAVADHLKPGIHNKDHTTLVHGDFKGANYFLKVDGEGCAGIDWQWTGPGIGAADLIYLFCGSVEDEVVEDYQTYLKLYHKALGVESYSEEDFFADFKVATLDYARWAFSVRLVGDTPASFQKRAANIDLNLGYFRRHIPRTQWLLHLVELFLPEAESGHLFFRKPRE